MTYLYDCDNCGKIEVEQRISDEALDMCPSCGLGGVDRVPFTGKEANGAFEIKGFSYKNGYGLE